MSATDTLTTPEQVTRETKPSSLWEKGEPCWKCSGTGRVLGFSHVMGGVCFRCGGVGTPLTKRGQAARAFFRTLTRTPAEVIRPGERVYDDGVPGIAAPAWFTADDVFDHAAEPEKAGSCALLRVSQLDQIEAAAERGATILPYEHADSTTGEKMVRVYQGYSIRGTDKRGTGRSAHIDANGTVLAAIDPAVKLAAMKTAAEYQLNLTKAGKPRKGTRYSEAAA